MKIDTRLDMLTVVAKLELIREEMDRIWRADASLNDAQTIALGGARTRLKDAIEGIAKAIANGGGK